MATYRLTEGSTDLGTFQATDPQHALEQLARDAGYDNAWAMDVATAGGNARLTIELQ